MIAPTDLSAASSSPFGRIADAERSGDPRRAASDFARSLAARATDAPARDERTTGAREAAEEFVALALIQPVLSQLRESSQAAGPFAPGGHEKQFAPLIDAELAKRITKASNFPLVDRLAKDLLQRTDDAVPPRLGATGEDASDA